MKFEIDEAAIEKEFDSYVKRVIRNSAFNYDKKVQNDFNNTLLSLEEISEQADYRNDIDEIADVFQVKGYNIKIDDDNLLKLIETMPEEIKNVLLLKFFQNFNDLEIANMLGLKRRTVNYRKLKAINYLKENL